jgi:hypothetical protein
MNKPLYWSHLADYEKCPLKCLWSYGWGNIDLGNGPGKKKPKPGDKSMHHAVMGIVIQRVLEDLYNQYLWKHPAGLTDTLRRLTKEKLTSTLAKPRFFINWNEAPSYEEMEYVCLSGVLGYLKTMQAHKFLGKYARSEVEMLGAVNKYLQLGGRADFIIRREDTGITMLDGKNSSTKLKYTDPDQLRWYALCFSLTWKELPNRLGFVWYRYPHDEESGETGVDWIEWNRRDLASLAERALKVRKNQRKELFEARPIAKNCRFCDYESVCPDRQAAKASNIAKRKPKAPKSLPVVDQGNGLVDFGFND